MCRRAPRVAVLPGGSRCTLFPGAALVFIVMISIFIFLASLTKKPVCDVSVAMMQVSGWSVHVINMCLHLAVVWFYKRGDPYLVFFAVFLFMPLVAL